jgi:hypothetical protein
MPPSRISPRRAIAAVIAIVAALAATRASAVDHFVAAMDGQRQTLAGQVLATAEDGGVLLMTPDGVLWTLEPQAILQRSTTDEPFEPLGAAELSRRLLDDLPAGFEVHQTAHYVIAYNTSRVYAQWVGALYERLYAAFTNYWSRKGLKLHEPSAPLPVIVFADQHAYAQFAQAELGG